MSKIFITYRGEEYILKSESDRAHGVLADRLREVRKHVDDLTIALRELVDCQNGPPLIADAAQWRYAMDIAIAALYGEPAESEE